VCAIGIMRRWPANGNPTLSAVVSGPLANAMYTSVPIDTMRCFATLTFDKQKKQSLANVRKGILEGSYVLLFVFVSSVAISVDSHSLNVKDLHIFDKFGRRC
jgi:hypothetical protein